MSPVIYITGLTEDGKRLMGGVWTFWHQEGFPIETAWVTAKNNGAEIDWIEAMADASLTNNLPALWKEMGNFLGEDDMEAIKKRYCASIALLAPEKILAEKKENGSKVKFVKP